jgi:hypothetical protein
VVGLGKRLAKEVRAFWRRTALEKITHGLGEVSTFTKKMTSWTHEIKEKKNPEGQTYSIITRAAIDSTIGTARGTTHGSCRPRAAKTPLSPL